MNLRLWRSSRKRAIAPFRLIAGGGLLALAVGALLLSTFFPHPAGAASKQPQIAPTGGTPRLEVLTTSGTQVYHEWSDDNGSTWSGLASLGTPGFPFTGSISGTPAAVSDGNGRLHVFVWDGAFLHQDTETNGKWSWDTIPADYVTIDGGSEVIRIGCNVLRTNPCNYRITSSPAVSSWGPGRMDLFASATRIEDGDRVLVHTWADNSTWSSNWEVLDLGTIALQGTPTVVSPRDGRIDLFARGANNELEHTFLSVGRWSGWENLGGILTSDPSVTSPGDGLLNVYGRGTDGQLYGNSYNFVWSGWSLVGCCPGDESSSVAAVSPAQNTVDVFVIGTDQSLYRKVLTSAGWTGWQFSNHHPIDYANIAVAEWFPPAPTPTPTPRPPTPTPTPLPKRCPNPPCPVVN